MFETIKTTGNRFLAANKERKDRRKKNLREFIAGKIADILTRPSYNQCIRNEERLTVELSTLSGKLTAAENAIGLTKDESYIKKMFWVWIVTFLINAIINGVVFFNLFNSLAIFIAVFIAIVPSAIIWWLRYEHDNLKMGNEKAIGFYVKVGIGCLIVLLLLSFEIGAAGTRAGYVFDNSISKVATQLEQEKSSDNPDEEMIALYQSQQDKLKENKQIVSNLFVWFPPLILVIETLSGWYAYDKKKYDKLNKLKKEQKKIEKAMHKEEDNRQSMIETMRNKIIKKLNKWGIYNQNVLGMMGLNSTPIEGEVQELRQRPISSEHDVAFGNAHNIEANDDDQSIEAIAMETQESEATVKNNGLIYNFEYDD
ncbi:MAG: hypothetical protein CVU99_06685 [Firmicutes bacterium HGW-Firmicutes-4]|jgi:Flp pilus assembly protein TadB|nr:MAG: hypothetical protein CVU99_06685 [Firmicutes bacterium HGW-Firmicutes-4]